MTAPPPDVEILTFNLAGPVLAVRPYRNNKDYWQVYFDTNRLIKETFTAAAFEVPEQHYVVRGVGAGAGVGMATRRSRWAEAPDRVTETRNGGLELYPSRRLGS